MKWLLSLALIALVTISRAPAQSSVDDLESDLKQYKTQHDQANSKTLTTFLSQLDTASQSGGVALELYKNAGGSMPDLAPVAKHYEYETPTEKARREAQDAQSYATVAIVVQIHCGLMRSAATLVLQPKSQDVHDQFVTWLKTMATVYPQLAGTRALKSVAMRDSKISSYLGFHGWGDSKEGSWSIESMPQLFKDMVLQPLRNPPGPGTLDAWDTYIGMLQADEPDHDRWTNMEEPPLDFDRTADDFAIEPTIDKLAQLDQVIKGNQANDHVDEWIARTRQMISVYKSGGGAPHAPSPTPTPGTTGTTGVTPGVTPGTTSSGTTASTPSATPGTPSSGGSAPTPVATPGTPSSSVAAPALAPTPGTPSSGGNTATP